MTVTHSEDYWNGYDEETNFGGGVAGIAYAATEAANTAALTEQSQPMNETQIIPVLEFQQTAFESAGQGKSTKQTFTVDTRVLEGEKHQFVQDVIWITRAIAGTAGAVPVSSWCEVYKDGQRLRSAYGCHDTQYVLNIPTPSPDAPPKESITYNSYIVKDTVTPANFATAKAWLTTAPKEHFDFRIALAGTDLSDWTDATLTITKEYTEKTAGQAYHKYPYLQKHSWELTISTYDYPGVLLDLETSAANLFEVEIAFDTPTDANTLELTEMKIQPDSINIKEVPEKGMKLYTFTIEIGGASIATFGADD